MSISRGTHLGPYEILGLLGAGGMGEVYRARDARLGRDVAVKVLPAELAADRERLARFEQEARAAAALNHPHILALYDIGTHDGVPYLVTELLSGQTLGELLLQAAPAPSRGRAAQLAAGAPAARAGIVLRLEPDNVFVTSGKRVKISTSASQAASRSPARARHRRRRQRTPSARRAPGIRHGARRSVIAPEQVRPRSGPSRRRIRVRRYPLNADGAPRFSADARGHRGAICARIRAASAKRHCRRR
jgi:hypothetical protein